MRRLFEVERSTAKQQRKEIRGRARSFDRSDDVTWRPNTLRERRYKEMSRKSLVQNVDVAADACL